MKYLIPFMVAFALLGCENNPGGSQDSAKEAPEKVASYVDVKPIQGMVNQHGLYRLVRSGGVVDDPSTSTGKSVWKPVIELVESTERIPLIKGAQLYLQYRIWYLPDRAGYIDLKRVLRHPEMTLPDGSVTTGSDFTFKAKVSVNQAIGYTGYGLDEDYELVEGDWVFEIWYQDKKLIEQKFTTDQPDKEEIAALQPRLALGNKVFSEVRSPGHPDRRFDWPRVIVGGKGTDPDRTQPSDEPANQP